MKKHTSKAGKISSVRIIGGKFRGRQVYFEDGPGLRPTQDRIRETVFNWLQGDIVDAVCLDLFGGSGALGFESVSRGAKDVVICDNQLSIIRKLQENASRLGAQNCAFYAFDLTKDKIIPFNNLQFDIVFVDPPFQLGLVLPALDFLRDNALLADNALVYVECELSAFDLQALEKHWQVVKNKSTKTMRYMLLAPND